jgi:hypothetical protein
MLDLENCLSVHKVAKLLERHTKYFNNKICNNKYSTVDLSTWQPCNSASLDATISHSLVVISECWSSYVATQSGDAAMLIRINISYWTRFSINVIQFECTQSISFNSILIHPLVSTCFSLQDIDPTFVPAHLLANPQP